MKSNAIKFKAAIAKAIKNKTALTEDELTYILGSLSEIHDCAVTRERNGNQEIILINPIDAKTKRAIMDYEKTIVVDICQDVDIRQKVESAGSRLRIERVKNKNAYIHHCRNGRVYVSYSTPIAVFLDNEMPCLRRDYKDFSTTTTRHVSVFKAIMGYPDVQYVRGA